MQVNLRDRACTVYVIWAPLSKWARTMNLVSSAIFSCHLNAVSIREVRACMIVSETAAATAASI